MFVDMVSVNYLYQVLVGYVFKKCQKPGRGFSGVHKNLCRLSTFKEHHLQLNLGFRSNNFVFTGDGFSLKSGFRNIFCSQEMDSVLIQVSRKFCVHQRILYW